MSGSCRSAIIGLGTSRPRRSLEQDDAVTMATERCCETPAHARLLPALYRRTRIDRRGVALLDTAPQDPSGAASMAAFYPAPGQSSPGNDAPGRAGPGTAERMERFAALAPGLAHDACAAALADADLAAPDVTHLVTVTCTGFGAPGVDLALVRGLGLRPDVQRVQVGFMGCHAAMNALHVADALARAHAGARVLVCCVELCSLHFQYGWDAERVVANALFADGAAALVVGATDGRANAPGLPIAGTASRIIDATEGEMGWRIGDHGFVMSLSPRVPAIVEASLRPWMDDWLAGHGLALPGVRGWAIHAGGPRIVTAAARALDLDDDAVGASRDILRTCGNMSSATVLFILERLRRDGAARPIVLLGFGPGLAVEAALLAGATAHSDA